MNSYKFMKHLVDELCLKSDNFFNKIIISVAIEVSFGKLFS